MSLESLYTVPELSKELHITERTIRFYESKDLITPCHAGNTRIFNYKDRARFLIILRAKKLGFSLHKNLDLYEIDQKHRKQSENGIKNSLKNDQNNPLK